ncbi:MAG: glycosyl transferase family 1, partial [Chloroflexi bacterium]|nr:glycosyl transferase family 1 [Chloroflexota bacterium]
MDQLERVVLKRKALGDYEPIVGDSIVQEIYGVASRLKGVRLLQLNSTATGGGVAELLNSLVPLEANCGLDVEWRLMCKGDSFFQVTKKIHNALQGQAGSLDPGEQELYLRQNEQCARLLDEDYDVIIVHDPQPAAIRRFSHS